MATQIPRYKKQPINAKVATEQLGGMADAAAAQGQVGIAQAQKGLSAQHGQRARQEVQSFASRLNEFSNSLDNAMAQHAKAKAQKDATLDVRARREKVFRINEKYRNQPKQRAKKIAELEEAVERETFSLYGRIYNNVAQTEYVNQAAIDANNAHERSLSVSDGDPEIYKDTFKKYMDVMVKEAPTEETQIAVKQMYEKVGIPSYEKLYRAKHTEFNAQQQKIVVEQIDAEQERARVASEGGDMLTVKEAHGTLKALLSKQVAAGKMSTVKANNIMKATEQKGEVSLFLGAAVQYAEQGLWNDFMEELYDPKTDAGKRFQSLTEKQREQILKHSKSIFDTRFDSENKVMENNKKYRNLKSYEVTGSMIKESFKSGTTYNEDDLKQLQAEGKISNSDAERYRKFRDEVTDPEVMRQASRPTFLVGLSDKDIQDLDSIAAKDKTTLIKERDKIREKQSNLWTSSPGAKISYNRIKRHYGIANNPFGNMGMEDKTKKAFDKMTTAFEREAEQMAAEGNFYQKSAGEVSNMLQGISDRLIAEEQAAEEEAAGNEAEKEAAEKAANILADQKVYNEDVWMDSNKRSFVEQAMITLSVDSIEEAKQKLDEMGIAY